MTLKCLACDTRGPGLEETDEAWICPACRQAHPIVGGVARFVPAEVYADSFGFQWKRFARTQLDSANGTTRSRDTFVEKTGWSLAELKGKRILDVGCGMGRFAEIAADAGAEVYGVDLSRAVEAAYAHLGSRPNVRIFQADVMSLPFEPASFDFIYSIGVLHHTPDTRAAFLRLPALLKPGGAITIWVYSTEVKLLGSEWLRKLTIDSAALVAVGLPARDPDVPCALASRNRPCDVHSDPDELERRSRMALAGHVRLVCADLPVEAHLRRGRRLVRVGQPRGCPATGVSCIRHWHPTH